jgi:hypothetical protein
MDECIVCYERGPFVPTGCGCRALFLHVECSAKTSRARLETMGRVNFSDVADIWTRCALCKQAYSDQFALDVAERCVAWAAGVSNEMHADALMRRAAQLFYATRYAESEADARRASRLCSGLGSRNLGIESHICLCEVKRASTASAASTASLARARVTQLELLQAARAEYGEEDIATVRMGHNLAVTMYQMGDFHDAAGLLRLAYDTERRGNRDARPRTGFVWRGDEASTLKTGEMLAQALIKTRQYAEATAVMRDVCSATRRLFGSSSARALTAMSVLGAALFHAQDFVAAERVQREVCEARERESPVDIPWLTDARTRLAQSICLQRRPHECLALIHAWGFGPSGPSGSGSDYGPFAPVVAVMHEAYTCRVGLVVKIALQGHASDGEVGLVVDVDLPALLLVVRLARTGERVLVTHEQVLCSREAKPAAPAAPAAAPAAPNESSQTCTEKCTSPLTSTFTSPFTSPCCWRECTAPRGPTRACSACGVARYCSRECQRRDWRDHRALCVRDARMGDN